MSKRGNNEGSIYEDKTRKQYIASLTPPNAKRVTKRFKTRDDASAWLSQQLVDIGKGAFIKPNEWTVGSWCTEYLLTYAAHKVRPRTLECYIGLCKHLTPIAHIKIQQLLPHNLQQLYNNMQVSNATKLKLHSVLHSAFKQALVNRLIQVNIINSVDAPKIKHMEAKTFTQTEMQHIFDAAKDHRYYPAILLLATSGIRLGEMLGLRWQDVDLKQETITIRQSLSYTNCKVTFTAPKTAKSMRKIGLPYQTTQALKEHKKNALQEQLSSGRTVELVFVATNSSPIQPRNFERYWISLLNKAGVEYKNLHCLRHTHASLLLANGTPITEVSKRLGHSKISVTLDVYSHCLSDDNKDIINNVQRLYFAN